MFKFLQDVPTAVALNAAHQAVRLLQRRVKPTVSRSKLVIKGISSSPTQLEFRMARQIVLEIQNVEGRSISSVEPRKVQKYVVKLADLMQKRVTQERKPERGRAGSLLDNLKQYEPIRASTYFRGSPKSRKKTAGFVL